MIEIKVARDFTDTPGGRYITEGEFSGELFRKNILLPKYKEALQKKEKLIIDLDGCYGYATSFLEEAFGGLARELNDKNIINVLEFISEDEPSLKSKIEEYIKDEIFK